ncbi:MAG: helix-turn-helix transcriptional regulator [Tessaracoccus sp.]
MNTLAELLGIDADSPDVLRAESLAEQDRALLDALVQVRITRGLTQTQVADALGVKQPSIAHFETHDSNPTLSRIRRYAHAVGALISHRVELDSGQLLDHRREEWLPAAINVRVETSPSNRRPVEVTRTAGARSGTFLVVEVTRQGTDLALAA